MHIGTNGFQFALVDPSLWVDSNLVVIDSVKECAERFRMAWLFADTSALLNLWEDISIQRQLGGARRNRPIFQQLQQGHSALGYIRNWHQCRVKIQTLTAPYRKLKDSNRSG